MRSQKTGNKTLKLSIVFDKLHCSPDSWLKKKFFVSDIYGMYLKLKKITRNSVIVKEMSLYLSLSMLSIQD